MSGKVIVTGAFGVLGRAVVEHLAASGVAVASVDVAPAPGGTPAKIELGGVDLTNQGAVEEAYAKAAAELGGITGLVNIAGGFIWELVVGGDLAHFDQMYQMNVRTAAVSCRSAIAHMGAGASIVNIGAFAAANNPGAGMASYAASKAGVHALTISLAEELKDKGVRVNAVMPTILDTPRNRADMPDADPAGWVKPSSAAKVIAFLLSSDSGPVTGALVPMTVGG